MESNKDLSKRVRGIVLKCDINTITFEEISDLLKTIKNDFKFPVKSKEDFFELALMFEREIFVSIFDDYDFNGHNAVDVLLTVSKEIATRFNEFNPLKTYQIKLVYPEVYQRHIDEQQCFIFEKIKKNIEIGVNQEMYRKDLSVELVGRHYLSRLTDLNNPELFPPKKFSFETLFNFMFDNLIRGIATPKGIQYYEKQILTYKTQLKLND